MYVDKHPNWFKSKCVKILVARIDRNKIIDNDINKVSLIFKNLGKWEQMITAGIDILDGFGFNSSKEKPIRKYKNYLTKDYIIDPIDKKYIGDEEIKILIQLKKDKERTGNRNNRINNDIKNDEERIQSILYEVKNNIETSIKWINLKNTINNLIKD